MIVRDGNRAALLRHGPEIADECRHFRVLDQVDRGIRAQEGILPDRPADHPALDVVDPGQRQRFQRRQILGPFGNRLHAEVAGQLGHRLDDAQTRRMTGRVADEGAVDLQRIGGQFAQVGEGGVAGAKIVQGDPDAQPPRVFEESARAAGVAQRDAFGHFEAQPVTGGRRLAEHLECLADEHLVAQRSAAQVHADETRLAQALLVALQPRQRRPQHPAVDQRDAPAVLGGGDDLPGRDDAPVRIAHAQQHLEIERLGRRAQRKDRLHFEKQPLGRTIDAKTPDQPEFPRVVAQGLRTCFKDMNARFLRLGQAAGAIRCRNGILEAGRRHQFHEANRHADAETLAAGLEAAAADQFDDGLADQASLGDRGVLHDDQELVAADPPQTMMPDRPGHPLADLFQDIVAHRVPEQVVDQLEAVHVEISQRQRPLRRAALERRRSDRLDATPVEDLGQGVEFGKVAELPVGLVAFGDVLQGAFDAPLRNRRLDQEA